MQCLFKYLSDAGFWPVLGFIAAPPVEFKSLVRAFQQTYEYEQLITRQINALIHAAIATYDYSTFNFLQRNVVEQHKDREVL